MSCVKIEMVGRKFGRLTVIGEAGKNERGQLMWECQCDCGNKKVVLGHNLRTGNTVSCGCARGKDLTGQRFGRLTVLKQVEERRDGKVMWECQCDCGKIHYVSRACLRSGYTKSCGCLREEKVAEDRHEDLTGQRFGSLTVIRKHEKTWGGNVIWVCGCDCGAEKLVKNMDLLKGRVTDCGCKAK